MARKVLFINESGAGLTHVGMLRNIWQGLAAQRDVTPRFALRDANRAAEFGLPPEAVLQAPVFAASKEPKHPPGSFGEMIFYKLLVEDDLASRWIAAWDELMAREAPDLVVTDYAPLAQMIAYGRWPVLAVGYGYTLPPAGMKSFFTYGTGETVDGKTEARIITRLNRHMAARGLRQVERLPEICAADKCLTATVPPFDPYLADRPAGEHIGLHHPGGSPWPRQEAAGGLAYFHPWNQKDPALFRGILKSGLAFDLYAGVPQPGFAHEWRAQGLAVSDVPFLLKEKMPGRAVALHMGGMGFALAALFAGVPQLVLHGHQENHFIARMIASQKAGVALPYHGINEKILAGAIADVADNPALRQGAFEMGRKLAPFRDRKPVDVITAAAVAMLS
ncbi:MAG: hypothetical protein U1E15_00095 [Hyphomicrobiales bacterium]